MQWKLYYGDGTTFSDQDGSPADAPAWDVQVIAMAADISIGRRTASNDYYWFEHGQWFGGDFVGLIDFLARSGVVKFGRSIPRPKFEILLNKAVLDPDLPMKTATEPGEPR